LTYIPLKLWKYPPNLGGISTILGGYRSKTLRVFTVYTPPIFGPKMCFFVRVLPRIKATLRPFFEKLPFLQHEFKHECLQKMGDGPLKLNTLRAFNLNTPRQVEIPTNLVFQPVWGYLG